MKNLKNELIDAVMGDRVAVARGLLQKGADANECDEEGRPLLLLVITSHGSKEMAQLLIEEGANLFWTNEEGVSLLDEAVERNRLDLAELLITQGIDPSKTSRKSGMTALMLAACFDYIDMMELLYQKGANLYAVDAMGLAAVDFAKKLRKRAAQKWIEEKMENPF